MKIGLNLYSLRNLLTNEKDFKSTLLKLKKAGCDFVQLSGCPLAFDVVTKISKEVKMPIVLTHSPFDRMINDLDNLIADHKKLGCKYIGLGMMPNMADNIKNEKELKKMISEINNVAKKMNEKGFTFFYHNHFQEFIHLNNGEKIFDYMIKNAPYIHFTLDTYWLQYAGVSLTDYICRLKGRIECVHLKDYMINKAEWKPEFTYLGNGNIDFKSLVPLMKKAGVKYFLIEQDNAAELNDGLAQVIKSIKYAKERL